MRLPSPDPSSVEATRRHEARIVADALARLALRFDLKSLPLSAGELETLASHARESYKAPAAEKERLREYKAHLSARYGEPSIGRVWAALEQINNDIGLEKNDLGNGVRP